MARLGAGVRGLAAATHPGPTVMVTLFSLALALRVDPDLTSALLVAAAVGTGQLSIGWSNDWLDAARDRQVGRSDKPTVRGVVAPATVRTAALAALVACVVLSLATGVVAGLVHLVAVASGWSYNAWFKRTALSWLPYAVSFGLLPAFVVAAVGDGRLVAVWTVVAAGLLGVGAHVANALPDLEDDVATGVRGLPHRLGRRTSSVLAPVVLAAGSLVTLLGPPGAPTAGPVLLTVCALGLAAGAGAVGLLRPQSRAPFGLSMAVAAVCVVQLVLAAAELATTA